MSEDRLMGLIPVPEAEKAQLHARMRAAGWVVLEDHPRQENENSCDYWKRIEAMMPEAQRQGLAGTIAHIGTYKLVSQPMLLSEDLWKNIMADDKTRTP